MGATVVFHGTQAEAMDLVNVTARNCTCERTGHMGALSTVCEVHRAMVNDQRFLDGLLFMRHDAEHLLIGEFSTESDP